MADDNEVLLCCFLWASPQAEEELTAYENSVLAFVPDVGGEVVSRVKSDGANNQPHEVQVLRFPSKEALDAFVTDPRRTALAETRDRVIARTELFPVTFL